MKANAHAPIGIFDSGIGGLTVMAAIRRRLPDESLLYLGDTARVPYGTKSSETVIRYAHECSEFLLDRGVKAIVVACNTASAYALPDLSRQLAVPVLGVVKPGAEAALGLSEKRVIGVIGTTGTIASNAYGKALKSLDNGVRVVSRACPLFVPLVEEGWADDEVTAVIARRYLEGMKNEGIDTLVLGCTHYPFLADVIRHEMGDGIHLVDSADTTAEALAGLLESNELIKCVSRQSTVAGRQETGDRRQTTGDRIYVTDLPARFEMIAERFLGCEPPTVTRVDL